jgi:hypothetical protein
MSQKFLMMGAALVLGACASNATAPTQDGGLGDGDVVSPTFDAVMLADAGDGDLGTDLDQAQPDAEVLADAAPIEDAAVPDLAVDMAPDQGCDPAPERCNGRDDDCDGEIDEHFSVGAPCGTGVGTCRVTALVACQPDGSSGCPAVADEPSVETCNGLDDDCDGVLDEDFDGDGDGAPACGGDVCAQCPVADPAVCRALCDAQDCRDENVGVFPAAEDICGDGIDQNCDGQDAPCVEATGRVNVLAIAEAMEPRCPDVNGDGVPDSALGLLGALANDSLASSVEGDSLNVFFAASGLAAPGTDGAFALSVLTANAADGMYTLDPAAVGEDGRAQIRFPAARAREGALRAGPGRFTLNLPLAGIELVLQLYSARIESGIAVDEALGLTLSDGMLWGVIREVDLTAALDDLTATCEAAEDPPSYCAQLAQFLPLLGNLLHLDQDLDQDGVMDGYSTCLMLEVGPAALAGWPVE